MLIKKLGEFGLIDRFRKKIKTNASVVAGSGDDCAVIKFTKDKYLLFTCDMIIEGIDFTLKDRLSLIGRKALGMSISDIAACGGIPSYCLVSLGIPKDFTLRMIDNLAKGIFSLAQEYRINLVGGDLSRAKDLTLDVSMLGMVKKKNLTLRNAAKIDDIIFVTGKLGGSIYGRHLRFDPRLKEAQFLVNNFKVNAMIDISDGLVQDLNHILEASRVGAALYENLIPLSKQAHSLNEALYMGEDFELLFTLSPKEAKRLLSKNLSIFHPIGQILDKAYGLRLIGKEGKEKVLKIKGFQHF